MTVNALSETDTAFMSVALDLANAALAEGDFPVGCVIADDTSVIAKGRRTGTARGAANEIDHAEINTLRSLYGQWTGDDRSRLTIYCTMEPCLMCFSAILLSGIGRIVYAYEDVMGGAAGCDRSNLAPLYREAQVAVMGGVLRERSLILFQRFFSDSKNGYWADSLLSRYTLAQPTSS